MGKNEKAAPGADTPKSGGEKGCWQASHNPQEHITTPQEPGQGKIAGLLLHGEENGILLRDLVRITGEPERTVRLMIRAERLRGEPILSNCRTGYYLPDGPAELMRCIRSLRGRAAEIKRAADALERGTNES